MLVASARGDLVYSGGGPAAFVLTSYRLVDAFVTSASLTNRNGRLFDVITSVPSELEYCVVRIELDGTPGREDCFTWDRLQN